MSARRLSRRALLGGAAVAVGLPLLEAMAPTRTGRAASRDAPRRLIAYYLPNGAVMSAWTPEHNGPELVLSPTLQSLAGLESELLLLSGLDNEAVNPGAPGHHAAGTAGFLTAALARRSEQALYLATSIDQLYARELVGETPMPSLQLGIDGGGAFGHCDNGYGCAYSRSISWSRPDTPMPKITSPRLAFDLLFGGSDPEASLTERAERRARRRSVLDHVREDAGRLQTRVGRGDRRRLEQYFEGIRALELRIEQHPASCDASGLELDPETFPETVAAMTEIMVLALRCDATRVISFMLGNSASGRSYPFLGVPDAHHDLSHHGADPDKLAALRVIEAWEVACFAELTRRLAETPDGEGSLLDHSVLLLSSELSNSNGHTHTNLPVLLAGRCGGALQTGRHLWFPPGTAYGRALCSILDAVGASSDELRGRGFEPLPELFAP